MDDNINKTKDKKSKIEPEALLEATNPPDKVVAPIAPVSAPVMVQPIITNNTLPRNTPTSNKTMSELGLMLAFLNPPAGLTLSAGALRRSRLAGQKNGLALGGLILSIVFTLLYIVFMVFVVIIDSSVADKCKDLGPGVHVDGSNITKCDAVEMVVGENYFDVYNINDISKWPGVLSANTDQARVARLYAVLAFGDPTNGTVNASKIDSSRLYEDSGVSYLSVVSGGYKYAAEQDSYETFYKGTTIAALNVNLFEGQANTSFDANDGDGATFIQPSTELLSKVNLMLDQMRDYVTRDGVKNVPANADAINWYSTDSDSETFIGLTSMDKSICVTRTDGWTQTTVHLDDGSGNFDGYRSLSILTDNYGDVVGVYYTPVVSGTIGL